MSTDSELIVTLEVDENGRKSVVVKLLSASDVLPHEHEEEHRDLVRKILGGLGKIEAIDNAEVTRDSAGNIKIKLPEEEAQEEKESIAEGEG